jgi:hypothetical protein
VPSHQRFRDWYWLPPHFVNAHRIMGDAVPPMFAQIVGASLMADLGLAGEDRVEPELAQVA